MEDEYPTKYTCPIMMDLMLNPVKASDGIIYEKNAIIDWYNKNGTSPYTREPLHNIFIEQSQLQKEIDSFISENNIKILDIVTDDGNLEDVFVQLTKH